MNKKANLWFLCSSIACFFASSLQLSLLYFSSKGLPANDSKLGTICASCFWTFMLLGIIIQIILSCFVKRWGKSNERAIKEKNQNLRIGLISFFKNVYGIISDVLFVIALTTLIISYYVSSGFSWVCYISLFLTVFSFCVHCVCNGKNFYYIINQNEIENMRK